MRYLRLNENDYDKLLDKDVKNIQMDICDFITYYKSQNNSAAIFCYIAAINKFYSMNDVTLNWKKINSYRGEHEKIAEDRPYTHSEIQTLISHASIRYRAIILLMSSGGLRLGAIPLLRVKDLNLLILTIIRFTKLLFMPKVNLVTLYSVLRNVAI